jgi:hypothetical protein
VRFTVMRNELLNEFARIADYGQQQDSRDEGCGAGWWGSVCLCRRGRSSDGGTGHKFSSFLRAQLPGNGFHDTETDQQGRGKG